MKKNKIDPLKGFIGAFLGALIGLMFGSLFFRYEISVNILLGALVVALGLIGLVMGRTSE